MLTESEAAFVEVLLLEEGVSNLQLLPLICQRGDQTLPDAVKQAHFMDAGRVGHAFKRSKELLVAAGHAPHALGPGTVIGPFQLKQCLGEGPSGSIWAALLQGQPTLVRLLPPNGEGDPQRVQRFVERSNAGLPPPAPNLLKIDDAGEDEGWLYASTLGAQAQTLARALTTSAPFPEASALKCALGIAEAIAVAHGVGVVHGGLNPLAVLIGPQGQVQLTDFGVSAAVLDAPVASQRPGRRAGTLLYAHPDLVAGDVGRGLLGVDDLYALGSLIYHMLTPAHATPVKDKPWTLDPPASPGMRVILERLLGTPAGYGKIEHVLADLRRLAQGMPPGEPPEDVACIQGRRYPSATTQLLPRTETPRATARRPARPLDDTASSSDALPAAESLPAADEEAEPERTASGRIKPRSQRLKGKKASERIKGKKVSERLKKRPSERLQGKRASERLKARRSGAGPVEAKPGHGLGVFLGALVLVVGGGAGAWISQGGGQDPSEPLDRGLRAALSDPTDYVAAFEALDSRLRPSETSPEAHRVEALLERKIERERRAAGADVAALEALQGRLGALPAAVRLELELAPDTWERDRFKELGERLYEAGDAAGALEAYRRAGVAAPAHVAWAGAEAAFLPELRDPAADKTTPAGYLGKREVSRADFRRWAAGAKVDVPSDWAPADDALPATGVHHADALAYAGSLAEGASLPPLAIYRVACAGGEARPYPWGARAPGPLVVNANAEHHGLLPSGTLVAGCSRHGLYDLLGNAAEHTLEGKQSWGGDAHSDYASLTEPQPGGADLGFRVATPLAQAKALDSR